MMWGRQARRVWKESRTQGMSDGEAKKVRWGEAASQHRRIARTGSSLTPLQKRRKGRRGK